MKKIIAVSLVSLVSAGSLAACGSSTSKSTQANGNSPALAQSGTPDAAKVATDLKALFDSKNVKYNSVPYCTHKSGNDFVCEVDGTKYGKAYPDVTDDGVSIYEQGIPAS